WKIREDGSGLATRSVDGVLSWPGWEDAAVPPKNLGGYLRDFHKLLDEFGLKGVVYGHFGEGCLHVRLDFDLRSDGGVAHFQRLMAAAAELVVQHGGALSGEHGDGRARSEHLPAMYSQELIRAFGQFKAIWDPRGRLNPGVIVEPAGVADDLRMHHEWRKSPRVELALHDDRGSLGQAAHRRVGVAPGRAGVWQGRLLGAAGTRGWKSPEVGEALDLCLSCKGCRIDCPVGVDMARYKSECPHRRYTHRIRPASHYSMAWLPRLARVAAK